MLCGAIVQRQLVHDDATEEVRTVAEAQPHFAHLCDGLPAIEREHLPPVVVVRIEGLRVQRLAGLVLQRDGGIGADEAALELNGDGGHGERCVEGDEDVLRRGGLRAPGGVLAPVEEELLAVLLDVAVQNRTHAAWNE